ncbi:MAG: outer membrane beta-barrel protein [Candidatus Eisenbacteria bacterium]
MRKISVAAAMAVLVLSAPLARAEGVTFGLQGGASFPMGDYGDAFGTGPQGGVFADWWLNPSFALGLDLNGNFHKAGGASKDSLEAAGFSADDFKFAVTQFSLHGKWKPAFGESPSAAPWLQFGAGLYSGRTQITSGGLDINETENKFGFGVGAGIDFPLNEALGLGFNAHLHNVTDAIQEFDPSTGNSTGDTKSARYFSLGVALTFATSGGN